MEKFKIKMKKILIRIGLLFFTYRTLKAIVFELIRFYMRMKRRFSRNVEPVYPRLHLGCGGRRVSGWLNVDVVGSDYNVDIGGGRLPWANQVFEIVVAQHVFEHLEMEEEGLPLLIELFRICKPGATIYLSCPHIGKICRAYVENDYDRLRGVRSRIWPSYDFDYAPKARIVNDYFHQGGEHKNLYDAELIFWLARRAGFSQFAEINRELFHAAVPGFPDRDDDDESLYVELVR